MELKDSNSVYKAVTEESIVNVPKIDLFDDELNSKHQKHCKELLEQVRDKPIGTEMSIIYDENMNSINGYSYVTGDIGKVRIDNPDFPYHAFHNHGSGETFSPEDLLGFASHKRQLSLTAQGNNGNLFVITKENQFNRGLYFEFLIDKIKNAKIYKNYSYYDIKYLRKLDTSKLTDKEIQEFKKSLVDFSEECAKGGKDYGFIYSRRKT